VIVLNPLLRLPVRILDGDAPLQTSLTAPAVAGQHLNAIQGGDDPALHPPGVERLVPFQFAIDVDLHFLQPGQVKPAQAVTRHVVTEGPISPDPALQGRLGQVRFELLETAQAEHKGVEHRPKDRRGGDLRLLAGILQNGAGLTKVKHLIQIAGKGGPVVGRSIFLLHRDQTADA